MKKENHRNTGARRILSVPFPRPPRWGKGGILKGFSSLCLCASVVFFFLVFLFL